MKITLGWLEQNNACGDMIEWFKNHAETDVKEAMRKFLKEDNFDWANWIIVRIMDHEQCLLYAIFSAKQVIDIYEKKYPNDGRPRIAIESAKKFLVDRSIAAADIATAARAVALSAAAASISAYVAIVIDAMVYGNSDTADENVLAAYAYVASAAQAASYAAATATHADDTPYYDSAERAANCATHAVDVDAAAEMRARIIEYGLELLGG